MNARRAGAAGRLPHGPAGTGSPAAASARAGDATRTGRARSPASRRRWRRGYRRVHRTPRAVVLHSQSTKKRAPAGGTGVGERLQSPQLGAAGVVAHRAEHVERDHAAMDRPAGGIQRTHTEREMVQDNAASRRPRAGAMSLEDHRREHLNPVRDKLAMIRGRGGVSHPIGTLARHARGTHVACSSADRLQRASDATRDELIVACSLRPIAARDRPLADLTAGVPALLTRQHTAEDMRVVAVGRKAAITLATMTGGAIGAVELDPRARMARSRARRLRLAPAPTANATHAKTLPPQPDIFAHREAGGGEELVNIEGEIEQACSNNLFCAYHSYIEPGTANEIIYADIPFSLLDSGHAKDCQDDGRAAIQQPNPDNAGEENTKTRFADVALKYISHEYIEAVTDPLVNEETAWVDAHGLEIGDKCNGVHGPANGIGKDPSSFLPELGGAEGARFNQAINTGSYYLQSEWDNGGKGCLMKPVPLGSAAFALTTSASTGSPVGFHGTATDPYGAFEPAWTFGDGGIGVGASPSHTYAAPGEYTVTMTPKDALTDSTAAGVSHTITVAPPAPPTPVPVTTQTTGSSTTVTVAPSSAFATAHAAMNARTGALTFTTSVADPGTF